MANTLELPILGPGTLPDTSGNVYYEALAATFGSNKRYPGGAYVFKDTSTKDTLGIRFHVPRNYVSTPVLVLVWATTVTSGNVQLGLDYTSNGDGATADPSADEESVNSGAVAVPGTARLFKYTTISLTAGNFAAQDEVQGRIFRDGTSGNDTAAASVYLFNALFRYNDA